MLGRLGGHIAVLGSVDRVVVGPEIRNYDVPGPLLIDMVLAAERGNVDVVGVLADDGVDLGPRDKKGRNPLHRAVHEPGGGQDGWICRHLEES